MSRPSPTEVASVLSKRADVLDTLREQPRSKSEICDAVGVSRSTVDRAIDELGDFDIVERSPPDGYRQTELGCLLCTARNSFWESIEGAYEASAVESRFPGGDRGEAVVFDGAEVVRPRPHEPDRPLQHLLDLVETADRFRGFSPVVLGHLVDACHERVADHRLDLELVVTQAVLTCLRSRYREKLPLLLAESDVRRYTAGAPFPFGLGIFDHGGQQTAILILCSRNGISGVVENDSRAAVGWAGQLFEETADAATRVLPD
ncbi:helix-turn-helix transcriptional regulator [Halorientalis pallida]|uniref:ArsR family transcriptional regulator n=1 Tax=Halorientalis pallida TaxID=2479928 RepID=A0A498KY84_9EURY|nr:ArsR family transcriptional regulator [Halorientalis pallida]RXK46724.1 ArsR family transcriptional regulator [Halorientalis pallida]